MPCPLVPVATSHVTASLRHPACPCHVGRPTMSATHPCCPSPCRVAPARHRHPQSVSPRLRDTIQLLRVVWPPVSSHSPSSSYPVVSRPRHTLTVSPWLASTHWWLVRVVPVLLAQEGVSPALLVVEVRLPLVVGHAGEVGGGGVAVRGGSHDPSMPRPCPIATPPQGGSQVPRVAYGLSIDTPEYEVVLCAHDYNNAPAQPRT